ncbi:TlpA family protein disulfide reductase [SAR86 cluster bacterium]|jgi:thiol-disulfide isomerase/thioredoxin|nr:TlpA family protein disulfide reductase [SAR86 cluster bacterium]|tara:strand:- start:109 stop:552 length:444 start_codon:yes stop_codon:yes gene_type:complete
MRNKIITLISVIVLTGCQKFDIDVYNGPDTSLENLKGKWVVINYWADWCPPCLKEMPELVNFANANPDINVYAFNYDELEISELKPQLKKFSVDIPSIISHPRDIWGIKTPQTIPATYFINTDGELVLSLFKPQTEETLTNQLRAVQ